MKRITWVPIVASVVLLLAAIPLFADDIVSAVNPTAKVTSPAQRLEGLSDLDFPVEDYGERGGSCESSGEVTNPF